MTPADNNGTPPAHETDSERAISDAAAAINRGEAVVYPTETVYGLGADATDPQAVDRVFELKNRPYDKPLSVAFADRETAFEYTNPTDRERAFINRFLPGPVTVIVDRESTLPEILTSGASRVGVRIPANETAVELCRAAGPITATSANVSGNPSVRQPADLSASIRNRVGAVIDIGQTAGTESTVVDIETGQIHRRGALVEEIEAWLEAQ
jgi:L-threonylcarbamoyladenylate synthase